MPLRALQVARRILMGTYALSAGYYDAYYKRAQQARCGPGSVNAGACPAVRPQDTVPAGQQQQALRAAVDPAPAPAR